jgi:phosphate-selective porin OprO/OprP
MNGVPNNSATVDIDNNDGKDFVGRLFAMPFKLTSAQWARGFGFGFAATLGSERGNTTSVYKTYGQTTYFSYNKGVTAAGQRVRLEPQAYYYWRGLGLMAEWVSDSHKLNRNTTVKHGRFTNFVNDYATFTDTGYMAQASYLLTGENATYGRINPKRPFDPREGTWGGWELAARISNVAADPGQFKLAFADPSISAKTATEWALGINWYLSDNVKWQFDYARTFFNWGAGVKGAVKDRPDESVFESQFQIAF